MKRMLTPLAAALFLASASLGAQTQDPRDPQPSFKDYVDLYPSEAVASQPARTTPREQRARNPQPSFRDFVLSTDPARPVREANRKGVRVPLQAQPGWPEPSYPYG